MQVPLEISYRDVEKTDALQDEIDEEAAELEKVCDYITSCRVAVERPHEHPRSGNPFRVRIDVRVPPSHELVATHEPQDSEMHELLHAVLSKTFDSMRRQLEKLVEQQRGEVKSHPQEQLTGFVQKLFRDEGYGFLKTVEGEDIYFHENSVLHNDFDRLEIGTQVRYVAEMGKKGPQASTVQIVDKPGVRSSRSDADIPEPPLGWNEREV
ncbi:HPF/RaiA family ribosome-associated protein [candidate division KSB1 bacterium]|nr:HPF/RaiA family ribosome-associated protein [candidate division KSB1 bacterium]NIR68502.1 HPF/RaiA family ribosome-associated protein [candidate division KSB1 bacterium]NIS22516.1 HPF/RaiA family ribosome-associated protein [candidate division KSB1 bacterium]NIT69360.1 HPF/RaiA family ribosome-associated protein [candidate division KSB1 bacterium]NIU23021.1 HPF/RaiA family ribosome-associated protein [candidate division KSB1 bacterium]